MFNDIINNFLVKIIDLNYKKMYYNTNKISKGGKFKMMDVIKTRTLMGAFNYMVVNVITFVSCVFLYLLILINYL